VLSGDDPAGAQAVGLFLEKGRKLLNKADPDQRAAFLEQLQPLLMAATRGQRALVYIDEAHFRQDTDGRLRLVD